jgi:poly(ADP-ribose) glycohydrolase
MHYFHAATQPCFDINRRIRIALSSAADDMKLYTDEKWPEVLIHTSGLTDDPQDTTFANFANATYMFGKIVPSLGGVSLEELTQMEYAELLIGLLYFGKVDEAACIIAEGVKKFGEHTGYLTSFKCAGASEDARIFRVVTMDAKNYSSTLRRSPTDPEYGEQVTYSMQFHSHNVLRDVKKAYAGFRGQSQVATGMWGCGQFKGNCFLKLLQQYLAAAHAGVSVMSFSCFNNQPVADKCQALIDAMQRSGITTSVLSDFLLSKLPQDATDVADDSVFLSHVFEWLAAHSK